MAVKKGSLVLLKVGDGGTPTEDFTTLGGLMVTRLVLENRSVSADTLESGAWRTLLPEAGLRRAAVEGRGLFTNTATEETVRAGAFAGAVRNWRLYFPSGDYLAGPFLVAAYQREGDVEEAEACRLVLESAGAIAYTGA